MPTPTSQRRPLLVIDLSLFEAMSCGVDFPAGYDCIVPDRLVSEMCTKADPARAASQFAKFKRWSAKNADRLWIGRHPNDLFKTQLDSNGAPLDAADLVNGELTAEWLVEARRPDRDVNTFVRAGRSGDGVKYILSQSRKLTELCDNYAEFCRANDANESLNMRDRAELLKPAQVVSLAERYCASQWRTGWRECVDRDGDRFALIRWLRFIGWYCLKRRDGQKKDFQNNFDDAEYGLLASYTGHLGTKDGGLKSAAEVIFPGVAIVGIEDLTEG
jgi:hypothetical protein